MDAPAWWTTDWSPSTESGESGSWPGAVAVNERDKADTDAGWVRDADYGPSADNAILAPLVAKFGQVRSRERVRDLAEVFTDKCEVDAMLDLMPGAFRELDTKFLEPSAGSGNFLVEILRRKLRLVVSLDCATQAEYEHRLLRAAASIYGIDISPQNVSEARGRLAHMLLKHYRYDADMVHPTLGFLTAAALVLGNNIVVGDSLNSPDTIELCDWRPAAGHAFRRVWSHALIPPSQRDLLWAERTQDAEPVRYSELAATPPQRSARRSKAGAR